MGELECVADSIVLFVFPELKHRITGKHNIVRGSLKRTRTHPVILPLRGKDMLSTLTKYHHLIEIIYLT
jgi:hypothetical protein